MLTVFGSDRASRDRSRFEIKVQLSSSGFCQHIVDRCFNRAVDVKRHAIGRTRGESIISVMSFGIAFDQRGPGSVARLNLNLGAGNWPSVSIPDVAFDSRTGTEQVSGA